MSADRPAVQSLPTGADPETWAHITRGLVQRMRLLDAMARQVYAPADSTPISPLPGALTRGHDAYLPMLHGWRPLGDTFLGLMTFDIARDTQGLWWVLGQCSRAALPWSPAQPPTGFLNGLRKWLSLCPINPGESPRWVVLLPQVQIDLNELAHEWAAWGISPARASDLWVSHQQLFMQGADGAQHVHGVINLQGHDALDPLEQACDLDQGIAGLFEVLRRQQVLLLNPPGMVFLDSPGWLGFLPALTQRMLGEDLMLPSVTSWWCGDSDVRDTALARGRDHWIIPTYPDDGLRPAFQPQSVDALSDVQRSAWAYRMRNDGPSYTVQSRWTGETPWRVLTLLTPDRQGDAWCLGPRPAPMAMTATPQTLPWRH
ncbi:MAG: circularly permuted type 2 ATP-grasp protein [Alphaproteobacteria bacterium]|nr:circularly permuted type 2 ATP-grasp protein [Alphaproteobacteria bacterium]